MSDAPERIWAESDPETGEKRWFSINGMGTEYLRADVAALRAGGEPVAWQYRWKGTRGGWSDWMVSESDPSNWTWPYYWEDLEARPLCAHPAPSEPVAVKPLEWHASPIRENSWLAPNGFGENYVASRYEGQWRCIGQDWPSLDAAKAAAQADYEARIRSALVSAPSDLERELDEARAWIASYEAEKARWIASAEADFARLERELDEARAEEYRVRRALSELVGRHGNYCAYAGQPSEAYHAFVTGAQDLWDRARVALGGDATGASERLQSITERAEKAEAERNALAADKARLVEALTGACEQILDSYRTWVADDVGAHPRHGQIPRYDAARAALSGASTATPADKVQMEAVEISMGHGLVDVGPITWQGRSGILLRPRDKHIPVGSPGELQDQSYWPVSGDVVIWIDWPEGAEIIIKHLAALGTSDKLAEREGE
ncbi:hypothetical protein [Pseudaminobacter soli (ex Li et al. 2025)]|uniref:hypothetical protein n=1 Tax=Pseudaminobacter soli (ex Li et al. 2025) TaxID=1295366 RepID=UPI001AEC83C8|nr:hypothetical protein [Mesorhizobium soli]